MDGNSCEYGFMHWKLLAVFPPRNFAENFISKWTAHFKTSWTFIFGVIPKVDVIVTSKTEIALFISF